MVLVAEYSECNTILGHKEVHFHSYLRICGYSGVWVLEIGT